MIKESIFSFLKIRKMPIIIFTGIVVIFGILFYLYDIPFDAIIYGCELSFVWCAVCLFIDFYKYYKRHKLLHINREQFFDDAEQLPEHMDIIEYDYQELAKELYQAKQELISKNRIAKKELLDYYGMWVHQIKTPIAALDILLQNTEQFLYEEDIVNSRINKRLEIIQESIPVSDMKMELFKIEQYVEMALNYLRVEDISSDLSFKQYAVDDMVRQVIRKYAKIFISKKIKMNFKPTGRYIVTDDKWFVFVLEQFISNALKYTKKGQISIYMKEKSLVIEDTGIGIPAEDLPRIFEKERQGIIMALLDVKNVRKVYTTRFGGNQVEALKDVNFSVEQGEYVAIMGESGSGKSTLLNILAALDKPTEGKVFLKEKDLSKVKEKEMAAFRRNNLGFVFQDFNLLDTFSLKDNIFLPLVLSGTSYREMERRLLPFADKLGIKNLLEKYPYEVSGGQKQRAAVARAVITQPQLLLADEPTGALDSKAAKELLRLFTHLNQDGQTILMVTHSVKAASTAGRVLFIKDGKVFHQIYKGSLSEAQMYQKISDTMTAITAGGEDDE